MRKATSSRAADGRRLVLASTSPRRHELLRSAGFTFAIEVPDVDESALPDESADAQAQRLALAKALAVAARVPADACVVAADTLVVIDGRVLGKPRDADEAVEMLLLLAGRTHRVLTGWALLVPADGLTRSGVVASDVRMHPFGPERARAYAATGEPLDKAGAYAAQGEGKKLVAEIQGSRSNVIGLPLEVLAELIERAGVARA